MALMRRICVIFATTALAALALTPPAPARVIELGGSASDLPRPACPRRGNDPLTCVGVTRTTAFQRKIGTRTAVFEAPTQGRVVGVTLRLAKPTTSEQRFFNRRAGGTSRVKVSVLREGRDLYHRVTGESEEFRLTPYFGRTVQFPLKTSLFVRRGYVVALTVPTWAPILATASSATSGLGQNDAWRASRRKGRCGGADTLRDTAASHEEVWQFRCLYRTERLTYTATMITKPRP